MKAVTLQSPAKLNLFLAITGKRADGFHDLVSVVTQVAFGDALTVELRDTGFSLSCDAPELEVDDTNLVLRAAKTFASASGWTGGAHFSLVKRIPMGAGLGGGSSNAVAALRALNQLTGARLDRKALAQIAAGLGSDCPLFLESGPIVMRGRGEMIERLPAQAAQRLNGREVLIFKPLFGINTAWAYRRMAAEAPKLYLPKVDAEQQLSNWIDDGGATPESLLFNNMEAPAFGKFVALPALLERLRAEFELQPRMSGSGSACFAFLPANADFDAIRARISEFWGGGVFVTKTHLL